MGFDFVKRPNGEQQLTQNIFFLDKPDDLMTGVEGFDVFW